jgi:hypothetical protein
VLYRYFLFELLGLLRKKRHYLWKVTCLLATKIWCLTLHKLLKHLGGVLCILSNMAWAHCKYWFVQLEYVLWSLSVNHKYCQLRFQHLLVINISCFLLEINVVLMQLLLQQLLMFHCSTGWTSWSQNQRHRDRRPGTTACPMLEFLNNLYGG